MRIVPSKPPSSSPTACSIVDLPDPEGPSSATISPRRSDALTPRSTSMVTSPWQKLRFSSTSSSATSLIAQHLHGIGIRRLVSGIERREKAEDDHHDDDSGNLDRVGLRRQFGEETDRRVPQRATRDEFDPPQHPLSEIEQGESDDHPRDRARDADRQADRHEDT